MIREEAGPTDPRVRPAGLRQVKEEQSFQQPFNNLHLNKSPETKKTLEMGIGRSFIFSQLIYDTQLRLSP